MTRTLHDIGSDADILFLHSARTPADIIFRRELDAMAAVMPNLRVAHICEGDTPAQRWPGLRGRLSSALLRSLADDLAERVTFTCGPAGYMASVRSILGELGYDMGDYHEESFSFERLDAPAPPSADIAAYNVEFVRSGRTITCAPDENILDAAVAAGLRPASSCGQGLCGTCKTSKLSGEVDMRHNGGIRPKEIAQQKILICCSKPLSDLRLEC
jgi:ferredoxin-NADP reductase